MSNRIIRLGGSHIGNSNSIQNLNQFLAKSKNRNFVVASAIPAVLNLIEESLLQVFQKNESSFDLAEILNGFYTEKAGNPISAEYQK